MSQASSLRVRPSAGRRAGGCLLRGVLILAALIAVLVSAGAALQSTASAADLERFPAPGRMIDLGSYRLHLNCAGESSGGPTVILEAGLGDFSPVWSAVQPALAQAGRVCSYDRAGLGWSDSSPLPRDAQYVAEELHALLAAAGESGPFVLVGHSRGGLHVLAYAALYPDEVGGLVLVDSTDILTREEIAASAQAELDERTDLSPEERAEMEASLEAMRANGLLPVDPVLRVLSGVAPVGVLRLAADTLLQSVVTYDRLPPEAAPAYRAMLLRTSYLPTTVDEMQTTEASIVAVRGLLDGLRGPEGQPPLGDLPLVMLDAGEARRATLLDSLSSQTTIEIVDSNHHIQLDQPERVIAAVRQVLGAR